MVIGKNRLWCYSPLREKPFSIFGGTGKEDDGKPDTGILTDTGAKNPGFANRKVKKMPIIAGIYYIIIFVNS